MCLKSGQCLFCKHYRGSGDNYDPKCDAFPVPVKRKGQWSISSIPMDIYRGEFDHTNPYPGDNGIRYEPKEETN